MFREVSTKSSASEGQAAESFRRRVGHEGRTGGWRGRLATRVYGGRPPGPKNRVAPQAPKFFVIFHSKIPVVS